MNGREHYREAERLLRSCQLTAATKDNAAVYPELEDGVNTTANALAAAQVHATLAAAAAMAATFTAGTDQARAWRTVTQ